MIPNFHMKALVTGPDWICWMVNGNHVRTHVDINFTNFGQYPFYKEVPQGEMWVDDVNGQEPKELPYYLENMIAQRQALSDGLVENQARIYGDKIEQEARDKVTGRTKFLVGMELFDFAKKHSIGQDAWGIEHYLMDGEKVRSYSGYVDWVEGGHWLVYPQFTPEGHIWIDDQTCSEEMLPVRLHEGFERNIMETEGLDYKTAHDRACVVELETRRMFL